MSRSRRRRGEKGVMLLEALIAILIFSIGILALIAMQGRAIAYSTDAKIRSDASFLANEILSQMWVDRGAANANLPNYVLPGGTEPDLLAWVAKVNNTLPGAAALPPIIAYNAATGDVDVTLRWQLPSGEGTRSYRVTGQISPP